MFLLYKLRHFHTYPGLQHSLYCHTEFRGPHVDMLPLCSRSAQHQTAAASCWALLAAMYL